jgi:hypothetical protein
LIFNVIPCVKVGFKTQPKNKRDLTLEETVELVKDALTCAGERDIYTGMMLAICFPLRVVLWSALLFFRSLRILWSTGDSADIWIITAAGTQKITFQLKKD